MISQQSAAPAIDFDREVLPPRGHFVLFHGGQDIWVGPAFAGRTVTVWADDRSIHVTTEGNLLETFGPRTSLEDLTRVPYKFGAGRRDDRPRRLRCPGIMVGRSRRPEQRSRSTRRLHAMAPWASGTVA